MVAAQGHADAVDRAGRQALEAPMSTAHKLLCVNVVLLPLILARMTAQSIDERVAKWKRWCEETIDRNVLTMYLHRYVSNEVGRILEDNEQQLPESYWWEFMRDTYGTTQAVAVRRQADTHKDVASLGKLIEEIGCDASRITRDFWLGLWNFDDDRFGVKRAMAEQAWAEHYGGGVGRHLDPAIPEADLDALSTGAAKVKRYVDKHVAHAEPVSAEVTLTLGEVHDAIDVIGHLFKKYYNLLTAGSYVELEPAIQDDWKAVFRVPWMRSNAPAELQRP